MDDEKLLVKGMKFNLENEGYEVECAYDGAAAVELAREGKLDPVVGREKEIGSLEVGKCADLFLLRQNRLELTGACRDPKSVLCTVGVKGPVDYTVVNGRVTVRDGRLTGEDEEKLAQEAEQEVQRYLDQ